MSRSGEMLQSYERAGKALEDQVSSLYIGSPLRLPLRETSALDSIYRIEPWLALILLLLVSPILLFCSLVIAILSRRAPIIRHLRVGQDGSRLAMLKFRTMWKAPGAIACAGCSSTTLKQIDDPRVTSSFAAWCRRHSIDELPQLIHVVRGEMSLVGPRPLTKPELDLHYGSLTPEVLSVRPGITGLWQTMGRSHLTYGQRRQFDLFFVRNASPKLYFGILLRTIPKVLIGKDAW